MDRAYVYWVDNTGGTRLVWYTFASGGVLGPFSTAVDNVCNPVPFNYVAGPLVPLSGTPSADPYNLVSDSAVLTFSTALGTHVGVVCPGFKESLYLADNQTVDPAQPLVIALVAAALALPIVDSGGNPVVTFLGGLRQKRGY